MLPAAKTTRKHSHKCSRLCCSSQKRDSCRLSSHQGTVGKRPRLTKPDASFAQSHKVSSVFSCILRGRAMLTWQKLKVGLLGKPAWLQCPSREQHGSLHDIQALRAHKRRQVDGILHETSPDIFRFSIVREEKTFKTGHRISSSPPRRRLTFSTSRSIVSAAQYQCSKARV